jgi:hypothetical protein
MSGAAARRKEAAWRGRFAGKKKALPSWQGFSQGRFGT